MPVLRALKKAHDCLLRVAGGVMVEQAVPGLLAAGLIEVVDVLYHAAHPFH